MTSEKLDAGTVLDEVMDAVAGGRPYVILIGNLVPGTPDTVNWGCLTNGENPGVIKALRGVADQIEQRADAE